MSNHFPVGYISHPIKPPEPQMHNKNAFFPKKVAMRRRIAGNRRSERSGRSMGVGGNGRDGEVGVKNGCQHQNGWDAHSGWNPRSRIYAWFFSSVRNCLHRSFHPLLGAIFCKSRQQYVRATAVFLVSVTNASPCPQTHPRFPASHTRCHSGRCAALTLGLPLRVFHSRFQMRPW